eukprot:m51a1_g4260 hypothetical protein (127) ;mRNA; r:246138-246732
MTTRPQASSTSPPRRRRLVCAALMVMLSCAARVAPAAPADEVAVLCQLYTSATPASSGWVDPCGWSTPCQSSLTGVQDIDSNSLIGGTIPASIGTLGNLTVLEMTYMHLSGTIPNSIGDLVKLTSL